MLDPATSPECVASAWDFCRQTLPHVSRTFALTVPVLPAPLSDTVCCAYLLCRAADTVEDRHDLAAELRTALYAELAELMRNDYRGVGHFMALWPAISDRWLQQLMAGLDQVLLAFRSLPADDRQAVRACVLEMIEGMQRSHRPSTAGVVFVSASLEELETYCHYVAGTVGVMLTTLFNHALDGALDGLTPQGHRFGLGLQLTNILKDHVGDVNQGTSFIPRAWLDDALQLQPQHRALLVERTLSHLEAAHDYTLRIPSQASGMRLFCLWALWMAVATVREVARAQTLHPKISRAEVARLVTTSKVQVANDHRLRQTFHRLVDEAPGS